MKPLTFFCVSCSVYVWATLALPLNHQSKSTRYKRTLPSTKLVEFMKKYGYIVNGPADAEALYSEEGLSNVIKTMQHYAAIPETGIIDNATLSLLTKPRCGVADIIRNKRNKRYIAVASGGWKKREITFFVANWNSRLGREVVRKNILLALETWGRYGRLKFKEVFDPSADIIIAFGTGYHGDEFPFDGLGNVLAHAFFPNEHASFGGDIHFDDDEEWEDEVNSESEGTHFFSVALHEIGHALGLSHSPVPQSVMYAYYKGTPANGFALDYDDILGLYDLYIRNPLEGDNKIASTNTNHESEEDSNRNRDDDFYDGTKEEADRTGDEKETDRRRDDDFYDRSGSKESEEKVTTPSSRTTTRLYIDNEGSSENTGHTISYHGDDETVDVHKKHDDKINIPPTNSPTLPDICQGHYDAVAKLRDELFIFKDQYIWRLRDKQKVIPGYPIQLWHMFPNLPKSIRNVDAAYERQDGMIVLFTGNEYWVYDGSRFVEDSPKPLTTFGLPRWLTKIDAVQNWAKNGKTYFYRGNQFWRYNEQNKTMDAGYPMHMERWRKVPTHVDAALTWRDGITYFFKGKLYWKFDNDWVITTESSPMPAPQAWLGCPKEEDDYNYSKEY